MEKIENSLHNTIKFPFSEKKSFSQWNSLKVKIDKINDMPVSQNSVELSKKMAEYIVNLTKPQK